jgi:CDP-glycerol glycerophosphotransferase (TagB/SpsB family)
LIIKYFINILRFFFKTNKKYIVYSSFPDVSDNSFALFCYSINNDKTKKNVWLVNNINNKKNYLKLISNYTKETNFLIIKKKSLLGFYYFCKAKYIFHTHGLFNTLTLSKKQININLWHGMPLKNIGFLDANKNTVQKSNYVIVTSNIFKEILSKAFKHKKKYVLVLGQPRNDFMFTKKYSLHDLIDTSFKKPKNSILWMPTFRESKIGDIRKDGERKKMNDFLTHDYLKTLNLYLKKTETVCYIKLHPMDYMDVTDFENYSNIYFINNSCFEKKGISLYSVLSSADLLLTDFSSIYIDYLLLDKPIGFVFSDYDEYFNSRGFIFENPKKYMPGEIITDRKNLIPFLENTFTEEKDFYKEKRKEINNLFNEQKTNFSKRVFDRFS